METRPTSHQFQALVEFLEQNPGIAKGLRTRQAKRETRRKWQEFAAAANALGGVIKDGPAWSKYWADQKSALKILCEQRAQSMRQTGGGTTMLPELSLLEQRLVAVIGGHSFATGGRCHGLAVDPFPQSSMQPSPSIVVQPSTYRTTTGDEDILNFVFVPETEEQVQNPPQSPEESRLRVEASEQQAGRRRQRLDQQSRPRRRVSFLDTQVRRFEEIESRRVQAEMLTARALSQIAAAITDMARLISVYLERQDHPRN